MSSVVLVARLALAGVFALAGVSKLIDPGGSRTAVEGFGVPARLVPMVSVALPLAELATAVALLFDPSARWGAVAALVLLCAFSAGVARVLRAGLTLDCNCFGQVAPAPVSARTLARNGVLAVIALFAVVEAPGAALTSWTANASVANALAAIATVTAAVLAVVVYARRSATVSGTHEPARVAANDALPIGSRAPDFELTGLDDSSISLRQLLARGRPVVLIFASPTCAPCRQLLPHLARWNSAIRNDITLVVIESGWDGVVVSDDQQAALEGLIALAEPARELASLYRAPGTPSAIALTADGLVASQPMPGSGQIERLIRRVLETGGALPSSGHTPTVAIPA